MLLIGSGCTAASPSPNPTPTGGAEAEFRIIGYVTDTGVLASDEQLTGLTHINYAFALPQADGTLFDIANPWKLEHYVEVAHASGVKVLISVGGWGWDAEFEQLAATPATRATFVAGVTALVDRSPSTGPTSTGSIPIRAHRPRPSPR